MEMQKVSSSNIKAIGYDEANKTLRISFCDSGSYDYTSFDKEIFDAFLESSSKGSFFHRKILKNYRGTKCG